MSRKGVSKKQLMWEKIITVIIIVVFVFSMVSILFTNPF